MFVIGIDFGNENVKTSLKQKFKSVAREVTQDEYALSQSSNKIRIEDSYYIIGDKMHKYSPEKINKENLLELVYTAIAFSNKE